MRELELILVFNTNESLQDIRLISKDVSAWKSPLAYEERVLLVSHSLATLYPSYPWGITKDFPMILATSLDIDELFCG
jgi:hypothetical protein